MTGDGAESAVELDRGSTTPVPVAAVDNGRFREWARSEWRLRTTYGRVELMAWIVLWLWMMVFIAIINWLEQNWPAAYQETNDVE